MHAETVWKSGDFKRVRNRVRSGDGRHENDGGSADGTVAVRERVADECEPGRHRSERDGLHANVSVAVGFPGRVDDDDAVNALLGIIAVSDDDLETLAGNQVGVRRFAKCGPCTPIPASPFLRGHRFRSKTAFH